MDVGGGGGVGEVAPHTFLIIFHSCYFELPNLVLRKNPRPPAIIQRFLHVVFNIFPFVEDYAVDHVLLIIRNILNFLVLKVLLSVKFVGDVEIFQSFDFREHVILDGHLEHVAKFETLMR